MSLYANGPCRVLTDPEATYFDGGSSVVKFYGGFNEGKDKNGEYIKNAIDVEAWNKNGEILLNYAQKGATVHLSGSVLRQEWMDKETGAKRSKHILRVSRVELLGRSVDAPAAASQPAASPASDIDEIPF